MWPRNSRNTGIFWCLPKRRLSEFDVFRQSTSTSALTHSINGIQIPPVKHSEPSHKCIHFSWNFHVIRAAESTFSFWHGRSKTPLWNYKQEQYANYEYTYFPFYAISRHYFQQSWPDVNMRMLYRVILNYCWGFRGLYFSNRKKQNKTAYEIWMCNSKSFISYRTSTAEC
jgi:hypothetical protein